MVVKLCWANTGLFYWAMEILRPRRERFPAILRGMDLPFGQRESLPSNVVPARKKLLSALDPFGVIVMEDASNSF